MGQAQHSLRPVAEMQSQTRTENNTETETTRTRGRGLVMLSVVRVWSAVLDVLFQASSALRRRLAIPPLLLQHDCCQPTSPPAIMGQPRSTESHPPALNIEPKAPTVSRREREDTFLGFQDCLQLSKPSPHHPYPSPTHTIASASSSNKTTGTFAPHPSRGQAGGLLPFPVPLPLFVGSWLER